MTAKGGPLYAQNAGVTNTSDKEIEISCREQKINFVFTPLIACRQNLSPIMGQEKR
jgi:hypothetical protein